MYLPTNMALVLRADEESNMLTLKKKDKDTQVYIAFDTHIV